MKSHSIFRLVETLSPSEKRHFRIFANRHVIGESNNYLALFDAIQDSEAGKMDGLKNNYADADFMPQLTYNLHYLNSLLLRSLEAFRYESNVLSKLRGMLSQAELLIEKLLFDQADKLLRRLIKQAKAYEAFAILLEALSLRRKVLRRLGGNAMSIDLPELHFEYNSCLALMMNESSILELYDLIFIRTQQGPESKQNQSQVAGLLEDSRLKDFSYAKTFNGKLAWHFIHAFSNGLNGRYQLAAPHYQSILDLWEANPLQSKLTPERYAMAMIDMLNSGYRLDDYRHFETLLKRIRSLENIPKTIQIRIFWISNNLEVLWYMNTLQLNAATEVVRNWEDILEAYQSKVDPASILSYTYNICILHFVKEDFSGAMKWLNRILNYPKTVARKDIRRFARILILILHFELDNLLGVEAELLALRRFQKQEGGANALELLQMELIKKLARLPNVEWKAAFEIALENLQKLDSALFGWKEVLIWMLSKVKGNRIAENL